MAETYSIRALIETVSRGQIRIPAFQRGFVWGPDRVASLMDSIYKGYPFGSLLIWRTKEKLRIERSLGPFELPQPKEDYPVDYVLDGQQRVTAISAFFLDNTFGIGSVNTKTFVLLLAQQEPLSFISGQPIDLAEKLRASNRAEFHHLMPKDFLETSGQETPHNSVLANFAFISRADNRQLGGEAPQSLQS